MSYFRSYFEKNNTIIKNTNVNTAKNPDTEIFYGKKFSRFIFKVDLTALQNKIDAGELVINSDTRHYLKMTNTVFGDLTLVGKEKANSKQRTTSFDLILFKINEYWDEGVGFDYEKGVYDFNAGSLTYDVRPSNWYYRTTLHEWTNEGVYSGSPIVVATQHFDNGNENLNMDITDYVNGILLSGETNNGLGLAFPAEFEAIEKEKEYSVAFFAKHTQTFFEPFVESVFADRIIDNRHDFVGAQNQNLYLYVTKNSNYYDLDVLPLVDIKDNLGNIIPGLSNLTTEKVRKGIYKVTFGIAGNLCDGKRFFNDVWKNIIIDGQSINDIVQKFVPRPYTHVYSIGENPTDTNEYVVRFSGIKQNEKIKRGELKKIVIDFKSIYQSKSVLFDEVFYRIFIVEGKTNVIVHDWTIIDVTNENSFFLDTSYLIPREYFLEIKGKANNEEIFYNEYIKFEILSEK